MNPLDEIEAHQTMRNLASLLRTFYKALMDEGFDDDAALDLTIECMHDMNNVDSDDEAA